ncbi:Hypothetical predicted protein [Paramuricea clavata]|uniref:Biogenesis of lysosome-related organelles complex 1 subunit 3 n=1 Tax=Paramuricea clavata TaxID=317549 RepID=A0A6S7HTM6_PARCT|nr:Hypothetical predicted protein [Paramuricea clavata]
MAARGGNFVTGEASESDEEYEIDQSYFMKNTMVVKQDTTAPRQGILVEGEASESDESESENIPNDGAENKLAQSSMTSVSPESGKADTSDEQTKRRVKFHYDSGFHRQLRVSNLELRSDAIENRIKVYNDANKKLQSAVFYLNRSQASVQDIFSNVGLISGDLQAITDSLDKMISHDFLPTLKMGSVEARTNPTQEPSVTS